MYSYTRNSILWYNIRMNISAINFETTLFKIHDWTILRLPESASVKLPSRGMTMVSGNIYNVAFKTLLEADGKYGAGIMLSHWFPLDQELLDEARASAGDTVQVIIEPTKDWIEPEVPADLRKVHSLPL